MKPPAAVLFSAAGGRAAPVLGAADGAAAACWEGAVYIGIAVAVGGGRGRAAALGVLPGAGPLTGCGMGIGCPSAGADVMRQQAMSADSMCCEGAECRMAPCIWLWLTLAQPCCSYPSPCFRRLMRCRCQGPGGALSGAIAESPERNQLKMADADLKYIVLRGSQTNQMLAVLPTQQDTQRCSIIIAQQLFTADDFLEQFGMQRLRSYTRRDCRGLMSDKEGLAMFAGVRGSCTLC